MLWWLAETTVVAAALTGAVALLCGALRPRPAVRHALWLVVLLKLLMPPLLAWPWPVPANSVAPLGPHAAEAPRPPPSPGHGEQAEDVVPRPPAPVEGFAAVPLGMGSPELVPEPEPLPEATAPEAGPWRDVVEPQPPARMTRALVAIWAAGAVLMALLQLVRIARFRGQVLRGLPAPPALTGAVDDVAALLGVPAPQVLVIPGLASPVVWGLGRPRLLWPAVLLGRLTPGSERAALVHELAHLRRRDHWVGWLVLLASCVWWWSPLFWIVRRQLGRAAELACDAWVIETLPKARRAYAEALLEVCELVSRRAAPAPALGMGGPRQEIERRLTMILRESVPSRAPVRTLFGVVLLALIALPGFTDGQDAPVPLRTADPFVANEPQPADQPAAKAAGDDRERRLQKLEASLQELLKEMKELRGSNGKPVLAPPTANPKRTEVPSYTTGPVAPPAVNQTRTGVTYTYEPVHDPASAATYYKLVTKDAVEPIQLTRTTYTLSKEKAEALAALLKDLKAPVLETQVKESAIVVTTTPAAQHVVGEFVRLLHGKLPEGPRGAYNFAPPATVSQVPQPK